MCRVARLFKLSTRSFKAGESVIIPGYKVYPANVDSTLENL